MIRETAKELCPWKNPQPAIAWTTCSGRGGARFGTSFTAHVFKRRHDPGRWWRRLGWRSCRPATVSLACPRPAPVLHKYSRNSQTTWSNCSFFFGMTIPSCRRNWKKASVAFWYLFLVVGWTVRSCKVPKACLWFCALSGFRVFQKLTLWHCGT